MAWLPAHGTIAESATFDLGGIHVLEWKPRFVAVMVLLVAVAIVVFAAGYFGVSNWEW